MPAIGTFSGLRPGFHEYLTSSLGSALFVFRYLGFASGNFDFFRMWTLGFGAFQTAARGIFSGGEYADGVQCRRADELLTVE